MKKIILIIILFSQISFGQGISDALNISQPKIGGSARFQAMGGAFTALGGELSALQVNPASGAVFLEGQASFSYGLSTIGNTSTFYDGGGSDETTYNNLNQIGIVFVFENDNYASSITKYSLGFNYNRTNNFHNDLSFIGNNNTQLEITDNNNNLYYQGSSSLATSFVLASNGYSPNNLRGAEYLAFETFLIDLNDPESKYYDDRYPTFSEELPVYVFSGAPLNSVELNNNKQNYSISKSGYSGQYTFSGSVNVDNKVQIGLSYNRSTMNSETVSSLEESGYAESSDLNYFTYKSFISTYGYGNGFSLGAIYRANDMIRFGASYHSPTWYKLTDEYAYSMETTFKTPDSDGNKTYKSQTDYKYFDYEVNTPYKVDAGLAIILGGKGLISADYEYIGYSGMKLGPDRDFDNENREIKNTLNSTHNIRLGTEWKVSFISLRAGYSYAQTPYKDEQRQSNTQSFSLGGGLNFKSWNLDLSYQKFTNNYNYYIYEVDLVDAARVNNYESNFVATLRFAM
ncbi:MAG: outer membrane protein transport protein [Flavobacteriales bacterium]|nr:outer membrane protein transport protein [Flavobacteriales bacterium]